MTRRCIARSCLLVAFAVGARGAGGESGFDEKFAPPTPQVRQMWMQELAVIKRDMGRPSSQLEKSRDIVVNIHSLIHPNDKTPVDVVIRRTEALLRDLQAMDGAPDLAWADTALAKLREQAKTALSEADQTRIYLDTCAVRRRLALSNPLLDFDRIVFSRGSGWRGLLHVAPWGTGGSNYNRLFMNSTKESDWPEIYSRLPEGIPQPDEKTRPGLFVLSGYKTAEPRIEPLFMDAVLENGRHRGKKVVNFPGEYHFAFDLDYDGETVLFSKRLGPDAPYHIFKGTVGGTGLKQLTDNWFPDIEPCFLPSGQIAFISFRRWISARCLSFVPQACGTLFSMQGDGSDVFPLSWHETSEFFPTVANDGRLVYTRWDYIDRDFSAGHHLWTCYPDGRDPRAPHGNYPYPHSTLDKTKHAHDGRGDRPWVEFHIRAIPGTAGKYSAIAGRHHGSTPGVIVMIDTSIPDDNRMSQVRFVRGTEFAKEQPNTHNPPDAEFVTPLPLSESYYLASHQGRSLVLVDVFGNMELLAANGGQSPRPLMPRKRPPVIPDMTTQSADMRESAPDQRAVISVMDVYESADEWPPGTEIKALRITRLVPKPWSSGTESRRTVGFSHGGLPRIALGVVPVEEDGSAYFYAPVGAGILFQALDERGMAVHSMRSGTYVHPGEHLTCVGCHEDKWRAPSMPSPRLAFQREPSMIEPETSLGPVPASYFLLAKPVLEQSCIPCHKSERAGPQSADYAQLKPYVFYFDADGWIEGLKPVHGGYRTIPGRFGAMESRMGKALLDPRHSDLRARGKISEDDFRRLVLWLDSNSLRLGAYINDEAQRRGEVVWPLLEFNPDDPMGLHGPYGP